MDKNTFLAKRLGTQTLTIPGVGEVTVRAISRDEQITFSKAAKGDVAEFDVLQLSAALQDPKLSPDDVREWRRNAPAGELSIVIDVIGELSGTDREKKEIMKEAFKSFRGDAGA